MIDLVVFHKLLHKFLLVVEVNFFMCGIAMDNTPIVRRKNISNDIRKLVLDQHRRGIRNCIIGKNLSLSPSTVNSIIRGLKPANWHRK